MNAMPHFFIVMLMTSLGLLSASIILLLFRLLRGPSMPDRVMSIDAISMLVMCIIIVFAVISNEPLYLDIVIALALISFLGVIAFAQLIEWQLSKSKGEQ